MNAQLHLGEVAGAQFSTDSVETNPLAESDFFETLLVVGQVVREAIKRRDLALPWFALLLHARLARRRRPVSRHDQAAWSFPFPVGG